MTDGIEIRGVSHAFRGGALPVLDDVSIEVPHGAFVSLVGPSGCGKSTLLQMLAGLLVPDEGEVLVGGESVAGEPGHVAYMPQKDLLFPWRRALANATIGAEIAGQSKSEARERARALFPRFGLGGFERAWPAQLSGGMRQRLALLRTFLTPRGTLLLDEPFGALDAINRREMQRWMQEVWTADRRTVLFVTHDVEEALMLSDRVEVMTRRPGRIQASVPVEFSRPRLPGLIADPEFVQLKAKLLQALDAGMQGGEG